ncbi:MAG TPA: CapA family protein [Candidatus Paceibacterota bacterium]|nr:CapA family protein [Candidatus Paceibacterota bacterium]
MAMRWPIVVVSGSLGALIVLVMTIPPVRVAVTNVWERVPIVGESQPTRLIFVGDIMLSRSVGESMERWGDWSRPFVLSAAVTAGADLTFGNLESVISDRGATQGCTYCFRADPRSIEGLLDAGFDVVSVANNHAWDYGPDAFTDSLKRLVSAGITPVGGGADLAVARTPVVKTAHDVRVAYLAYTNLMPVLTCAAERYAGVHCYAAARMQEDITAARSVADIVVVSFHAGEEYQPHTAAQERIYRAAIDAGADLVIGHHPHVVQDVERYGGGWIAYSLGNFIFDQTWSPETMRGMLLEVTITDGEIAEVATRAVDISSLYQASLAPATP